MDLAFTHSPFMETKRGNDRDALYNGDNFQRNTLPQANENDDFSNQNRHKFFVQGPSKLPLYTFTGTQDKAKFKFRLYNTYRVNKGNQA